MQLGKQGRFYLGRPFERAGHRIRESLDRGSSGAGHVATRLVAELRPPINDLAANFVGDVFEYLGHRGSVQALGPISERFIASLERAQAIADEGEPIVVITHSMGGQIVYDAVTSLLPNMADSAGCRIDYCRRGPRDHLVPERFRMGALIRLVCEHLALNHDERATHFNRQAELMLYTVERIVHRIEGPNTEKIMPPAYSGGASKGEERVRKALGAIRDLEEVEAHMAPTAPELAADGLHPVIWQSAWVTWNTGQYRVAIGQASLALATQIKARAKSKLIDRKLVQDVFSSGQPKDGRLRLHFPGDREEESWRSRQDGLHMLAQGAYAGIRNISAHEDEEWSELQALEYLAVLSVVARWADETEIVEE